MYLVTGGAGFIGSNIVASLCSQGKTVIVSDWLGTDPFKWKNLANHAIDRIIRPEKLTEFLSVTETLEGVIHMGAISATTETDGDAIVHNNFDLSRELWQWCADKQVPFIYASSAATYGDGSLGFEDSNDLEYIKSLHPLNLYGWSKKWFDVWALTQIQNNAPAPPRWAGLKFFNVYGPNELHKGDMMSIVAKNFAACAAGEEVKLFKSHHPDYVDGGQLRDFVYVDDCVATVNWLLNEDMSNSAANGLFNVGSGNARSFKDLIETAYKAAGKEPNITYIDMPEILRGKYQYFTQADRDKLISAGFPTPATPLEDGVTDYMQNYLLKTGHQHR